jgi:hypothetical protein
VSTEFPFIEIPPELEPSVGRRKPGSRVYRRSGSQEECSAWFEVLMDIIGPAVSPGGVSMYCPVSRAAVHKRLKEGRLSIFLFHVELRKTTLFGKNKILREDPYGFVPVSECKAWRKELEERAISQGRITREEVEGAKPDWHGEFLRWTNKWERPGFFDFLKSENITLGEFVIDILKPSPPASKKVSGKPARKRGHA